MCDGAPPSDMFCLLRVVRQGGVLSPYLFAVYVNDIIAGVEGLNVGCVMCFVLMCIILYADDILLLAPSVNAFLQLGLLLSTCELELRKLDLFINSAKSVFLRIGPRRSNNCQNLVTIDGNSLNLESCIRYTLVFTSSVLGISDAHTRWPIENCTVHSTEFSARLGA